MSSTQPSPAAPLAPRRRWIKRLALSLLALIVGSAALLGVAEHETAKPEFCGSCHIMDPYYESWQADLHGGKMAIACVECHYAPGERTTINAKLRGLSQVASYVSGRYGATRPRAHVSNDSCLTSNCHGDQKFMDQDIAVGTVQFTHASHLQVDLKQLQNIEQEIAAVRAQIVAAAGEEIAGELQSAAREAGPYADRMDRMAKIAARGAAPVGQADLQRLSELSHRGVRVAQLAEIQCTNCHSYGAKISMDGHPSPAHHFSVAKTTCYTCHFNNEGFNVGTNDCLLCHTQLPQGEIIVHQELTAREGEQLNTPGLTRQTVRMNHKAILERNVNCISCHADVASKDAQVTRRDCERCHDQERFFADWREPFTVDQVAQYHQAHVPQQRAKCLDCHSEIQHELIKDVDGGEPEFLASVMSSCAQCHPHHHQEQLALLRGRGAKGVAEGDANLMFGARTNCLGCHSDTLKDDHGGEVVKATQSGCIACHGDQHADKFEQWKLGLEVVQGDADQAVEAAQALLEGSAGLPEGVRTQATALLSDAKADLQLVKRGNGVHNVTYAIEVLDSVTQRAQQAQALIEEAKRAAEPPANAPQPGDADAAAPKGDAADPAAKNPDPADPAAGDSNSDPAADRNAAAPGDN
ncbi:MAG: NapC/NirT family cytochrome c [Planctomycetaceae bacterium]